MPQVSKLTTLPDVACARGKCPSTYGQNLYLRDVSDDEVETAFVGRRRRSGHIRAPTFAEHFMEITYDCIEEYITVSADVVAYKPVPGILAVSYRTRNDSSQKDIIVRNKARNRAFGWTSSQYDVIPDTKNPQESSLGFPRKIVWNIARAIGRARAVYARFLFLISQFVSMDGCEVPMEIHARNRVSQNDFKNAITPILREEFSLCSKSTLACYLLLMNIR